MKEIHKQNPLPLWFFSTGLLHPFNMTNNYVFVCTQAYL